MVNRLFISVMILFLLSLSVSASILNVPSQYSTIRAALNASSNGDTINISAGSYTEKFNITKSITLQGNPGAMPLFKRNMTAAGTMVGQRANGITIRYINFTNGRGIRNASVYAIYDMGFAPTYHGLTVDHCEFSNIDYGVKTYGANFTATNNYLHNMRYRGLDASGAVGGKWKLYFNISHNRLINWSTYTSSGYGIHSSYGMRTGVIEYNTVLGVGRIGIYVTDENTGLNGTIIVKHNTVDSLIGGKKPSEGYLMTQPISLYAIYQGNKTLNGYTVKDNLILDSPGYGLIGPHSLPGKSNATIDHNLFYGNFHNWSTPQSASQWNGTAYIFNTTLINGSNAKPIVGWDAYGVDGMIFTNSIINKDPGYVISDNIITGLAACSPACSAASDSTNIGAWQGVCPAETCGTGFCPACTTTTTTTTTTLKPIIQDVIANNTNVLQGSNVSISSVIYQKTNPLSKWYFIFNGTQGNIDNAVNGSNSLLWYGTGLLIGNYTVEGYVNDSVGNINSSIGQWVNFYTTTTTTTTTTSTTTTTIPPTLSGCGVNATNVLNGSIVYVSANAGQTSNPLDIFYVYANTSRLGISSAVPGSNTINWNTSSYLGNYSVHCYVNDTYQLNAGSNGIYVNIYTTTTTTSTSTTSTTSTTTTSTTLPSVLYHMFTVPSSNSDVYVDRYAVAQVSTMSTCGPLPCYSANVTLYTSGLSILSTNPQQCGDIQPFKTCNKTFSFNVTGSINNTYRIWSDVVSKDQYYNATGFNLIVVSPLVSNISNMTVIVSNPHFNGYVLKDRYFDVDVNVTCGYSNCGLIYVYLNANNTMVLNSSMKPFYTNINPKYCGNLSSGMSCSVTYLVNATGNATTVWKMFAFANGSSGVNSVSLPFYEHIFYNVPTAISNASSNSTLFCNITFNDPDGDNVYVVNDSIMWYSNHTNVANNSQYFSCNSTSKCTSRSVVSCIGCVIDEHGYDYVCDQSGGVYVSSIRPVLSPFITPENASLNNDLTCNANISVGNGLTITYEWFNNNAFSSYITQNLSHVAMRTGDRWLCQVEATDGLYDVKANTTSQSFGSICPSVPVLRLPPNWSQVSGLPVYYSWYQSLVRGSPNGNVTYNIQVSNTSDFGIDVVNEADIPIGYTSNANLSDGIYHWRVSANYNGCTSNWSKTWLFGFVKGSCYDGIKNFHNGQQEVGVDCGGPCVSCQCAGHTNDTVSIWGTDNETGSPILVNISTVSAYDYENHCFDGCFTPTLGESDTDCGGFGQWACPACGIGKNCTSSYECADGSFCQKHTVNDTYGKCTTNSILFHCADGIFNPTATEADIDCGGDCNRCTEGKKCRSTLDCQDDLVCSPFDICVKQSDTLMRKKGRQEGGVGSRGYSMNLKYCSGKGDAQFQSSAKNILSRYINCNTLARKPTDPPNLGLIMTGDPNKVFSIPIDTSGFRPISDYVDNIVATKGGSLTDPLANTRLQYHLEIFIPYASDDLNNPNAGVYVPYYMASDGQEYACKTNQDCYNSGIFDLMYYVPTPGFVTPIIPYSKEGINAYGRCTYGSSFTYSKDLAFDTSNPLTIPGDLYDYAKSYLYDSSIHGRSIQTDCASICAKAENDGTFETKCPAECKHCLPMSDASLIQGSVDIEKAFCSYLPVCSNRQFRLSARLVAVNPTTTKESIISGEYGKVYYQDFLAPAKDDRTIEVTPTGFKKSDNYITGVPGEFTNLACSRPLFWDMTRCDGEGKITSEVANSDDHDKTYYDTTKCAFYDEIRVKTYASFGCNVIPQLNTLKEASCSDGSNPVRVVLDFSNIYNDFLSKEKNPFDKTGAVNKYYRSGTDPISPKKIDVLITRQDKNDKECLVYDNLGEETQNYLADKELFSLYMGGDSIASGTYGPRIRMPLCKGQPYTVSLVYMDKPLTFAYAGQINKELDDAGINILDTSIIDKKYILDLRNAIVSGDKKFVASTSDVAYFIPESLKQTLVCQDIKSSNCASDPGAAVTMLTGNDAGGTLLGQTSFVVDDANMETKDSTGTAYCFTDFYKKFKTSELINAPDVVTDYASWYGLNSNESATLGNLFAGSNNKWLNNFWNTFNPLDLTLPEDISIYNTLKSLFVGGVLVFFKNIARIILFICAKLMFWAVAYALAVHLWRKSSVSGNMSIYWLIIFIIAMLILFGFITSYAQFIGYFKFGQ